MSFTVPIRRLNRSYAPNGQNPTRGLHHQVPQTVAVPRFRVHAVQQRRYNNRVRRLSTLEGRGEIGYTFIDTLGHSEPHRTRYLLELTACSSYLNHLTTPYLIT